MMYLTDKYLSNLHLNTENAVVCVYNKRSQEKSNQINSEISDFLISLMHMAPAYLGLELQYNRFVCHNITAQHKSSNSRLLQFSV